MIEIKEVDNFVLLLKDVIKNPKKSKLAQRYEADLLKALDRIIRVK